MPLTFEKIRGSCRARYASEPVDQGTDAESVGFLRDQQTLAHTTVNH